MAHGPPFVLNLQCLRCGRLYAPGTLDYVCPEHANQGSDLGTLDVAYDYQAIAQVTSPQAIAADPDRSIGRYWPMLPIASRASLPPLAVGGTPLTHVPRLGGSLGLPNLFLKDDGRNPTASLKDRASAVVVARAREAASRIIAAASTGNAAASLAGQCAAVGMQNVIFVPAGAPQAKIAQLLAYGSRVLAVDGSYDQAFDLCITACAEFGWTNRNTGYNPYTTEGKKTVAYEVAEQLAALAPRADDTPFRAPDAIFVSVGDGSIIGGVHKGFRDLLQLGWITAMPRIYGIQSTASSALHAAWRDGLEIPRPVVSRTRADSIGVNAPRDPVKALNAVRQSGGGFLAVADEAILAAILPLARLGAVFAEPAGAAAYAGLVQARQEGWVDPAETVVVISTGSGLKDVGAAMEVTGGVTVIAPTVEAVREAVQAYGVEEG